MAYHSIDSEGRHEGNSKGQGVDTSGALDRWQVAPVGQKLEQNGVEDLGWPTAGATRQHFADR